MKQLLSIVALVLAFAASAEDQYFYWMLGDEVKIDDKRLETGTYYAKISADNGASYLNLYGDLGNDAPSFGYLTYDTSDDSPKVFAYLGSPQAAKYLVELYNDTSDGANPIGYADLYLAELGDYITSGGMSKPLAGAYAVSGFSSVPEPTSGLLLLLGVAGLALKRKRV